MQSLTELIKLNQSIASKGHFASVSGYAKNAGIRVVMKLHFSINQRIFKGKGEFSSCKQELSAWCWSSISPLKMLKFAFSWRYLNFYCFILFLFETNNSITITKDKRLPFAMITINPHSQYYQYSEQKYHIAESVFFTY